MRLLVILADHPDYARRVAEAKRAIRCLDELLEWANRREPLSAGGTWAVSATGDFVPTWPMWDE